MLYTLNILCASAMVSITRLLQLVSPLTKELKITSCFCFFGFFWFFRRKRRKTFNMENFVVLAEYFEQQTDCNRYRRNTSQSRRSPSWRGISRIYISLSNKWKPCHGAINSRPRNFKNGTENVLWISLKL